MHAPLTPTEEKRISPDSAPTEATNTAIIPAGQPLPQWAKDLAKILDDYGLDALIGLIPGVGDAATGLASLSLLWLALRQKVPTVILGRMVANILVDTAAGAFPVVGDLFDFAWRANKRNLALIEEHAGDQGEPTFGDYALVGTGIAAIAAGIALPFVALGGLLSLFGS